MPSSMPYDISKNLIKMSEVLFLKDELQITEEDVKEFITSEE
jgi:hypothetical protein